MRSILFSVCLLAILVSEALKASDFAIDRGRQTLQVSIAADVPQTRQQLTPWFTQVAAALALPWGCWPRDRWNIEVRTANRVSPDRVPWAQVIRGDPDTVRFYIDPSATAQDLISNWTAYHEVAHLLIPYRGSGDLWFSEGLASYYQNVLQARSGLFDEREMWQRLYSGLRRGQDNRAPQLTLAELSPRVRESASYMRVYWSGALYFLQADVELRRRSAGQMTLDTVLKKLNECCADQRLSVRQIAQRLDGFSHYPLFVPLHQQFGEAYDIGEFEPLLARLGVASRWGRVYLNDAADDRAIASAIATGQQGVAAHTCGAE